MKYRIFFLICFFSLFTLSCENECAKVHSSMYIDKRCQKIREERWAQDDKGVCDLKPEYAEKEAKGELYLASDDMYKSKAECTAFNRELDKLCDALPPPGPDDIDVLSGSVFVRDGNVFVDGKLVHSPDDKPICP